MRECKNNVEPHPKRILKKANQHQSSKLPTLVEVFWQI